MLSGSGGVPVALAEPDSVEQDTTFTAWVILPVAFHTPETGTGGGIAGNYSYKDRAEAKPSSIGWITFYTEKKQIILVQECDFYLSGDTRRLFASAEFRDFPDVFYGIGTGTEAGRGEDYTQKSFELEAFYEWELRPNLRIGPGLSFYRRHVTEVEESGRLDNGSVPGVEKYWNTTVGLVLVYDGRDNILYTMDGAFMRISSKYSGDFVGSDYRYSRHTLDLRRFFRLGSRQAIGLRARCAAAEGSPAFQSMAMLGGEDMMRGYPAGRFRDMSAYTVQAEYRSKIFWRFGLAAFAALGDVAGGFDEFTGRTIKFSGGAGIRFRLNDEGLNVRLDIGFTDEGSGLYFLAGEAF
jgi:outer membrane protein assembly factor BamA